MNPPLYSRTQRRLAPDFRPGCVSHKRSTARYAASSALNDHRRLKFDHSLIHYITHAKDAAKDQKALPPWVI